jgi:hypothetical protein
MFSVLRRFPLKEIPVRFFRILLPAIAFLIMATAMPANASTVLYTDRGLFEAELINPTLIDFNDQVTPPNLYTDYPPYPGGTVTLSGVTFIALDDAMLYAVDPAYSPANYGLGDGVVLSWQHNSGGPNALFIDLPAATLAVGFDFGKNLGSESFEFTFMFSNTNAFQLNTDPGASFAGFISDTPMKRLVIMAPETSIPQIDRFVFASSVNSGNAAVPEPASVALMACGIGMIAVYRRNRLAKA